MATSFGSVLILLCLPSLSQIKDEAFDEAEKKFRLQERLIKSFIRDISLYLQHIRVGAMWGVLSHLNHFDLFTLESCCVHAALSGQSAHPGRAFLTPSHHCLVSAGCALLCGQHLDNDDNNKKSPGLTWCSKKVKCLVDIWAHIFPDVGQRHKTS